jgi:hypothetical protein
MKIYHIILKTAKVLSLSLFFLIGGCKKFIEIDAPVTSTNAANVFSTDATAIAALSGIYAKISNAKLTDGGVASLSLYPGLSSDEIALFNHASQSNKTYIAYYLNALTNGNTGNGTDFWLIMYPLIYDASAAIEGLNSSSSNSLTPAIRKQLLGEAKFLRGFFYFYLVNLYGDVPLVLSTDYNVTRLAARSPKDKVYDQIVLDLLDAQTQLSPNYLSGGLNSTTTERTSPNSAAATALLARTYLFKGDYAKAEEQSSKLIGNTQKFSLNTVSNAFLKSSSATNEAIWQLQSVAVTPTINVPDAYLFILPATGPTVTGTYPFYLNPSLINSFESGDLRKSAWTGSVTAGGVTYYYPYKYKSTANSGAVTEYRTVLRLAEQYLIRSEARAQLNKITEAQSDLNVIRSRAGLSPTTATDKTSLINAILQERRVELFTEWGHRWFDLKRFGVIDAVMTSAAIQKGTTWKSTQQLYPIPLNDLQKNPSLVQNPGY